MERFLDFTKYITVGIVKIVSKLYSRNNLSLIISIWSIPKNQQRNHSPKAFESSISNVTALSLRESFSKLSFNLSYSVESIG